VTLAQSGRLAALVLLCWANGESLAAKLDALAADGLYTWRVASAEDTPAWCCSCWMSNSPRAGACDLDRRDSSFAVSDRFPATSEEMQIYVLIESGKAQRIRVLSPQCQVTSQREVVDLGAVGVAESLAWLEGNVTRPAPVSTHALAAIAVHKGSAALRFLIDTVNTGPTMELRKDAIFAMSQLQGERAVDALFAVLRNRQLPQGVREQALFWLAQSDSDRAFEYLDQLLAGGR
jgi:hypothetical protein